MRFLARFFVCLPLTFCLIENAAAADNAAHYVQMAQPFPTQFGRSIPKDSQVKVKYDNGDSWLTDDTDTALRIPKSAAVPLQEVTFDPPVTGSANQVVALYVRALSPNDDAQARHLQPNSNGLVIAAGETVTIAAREGNYYALLGKYARALVPVSAINVSQDALRTGVAVPIPPLPSAGLKATFAGNATPRTGQLYGRTKVAYTLNGEVLPPGSYLPIAYDAGTMWEIGGGNRGSISKAAIELVNRAEYLAPLTGRANRQTIVYKWVPDLRKGGNWSTLEQSEIFANMNPALRAGQEVPINAREGDDYIVEIPTANGMNSPARRLGRVPVSALDVVFGNPESGAQVTVPPLPQSTNANAPGYVAPRIAPKQFDDYLVEYGAPLALLSVIVGVAGALYRNSVNGSKVGRNEADYGVPHAKFEKTDGGFKVSFVRSSAPLYAVTHGFSSLQSGNGSPFAAIILIFVMIALMFVVLLWFGIESFFKTVITVDRDSVTIGRKRMSRDDFHKFNVDHSISGIGPTQVAVLGYTFGRRGFEFGGVWDHGEAQEVASALNYHLGVAPKAGDEHQLSPEQLRDNRVYEF